MDKKAVKMTLPESFKAFLVEEENGTFEGEIRDLPLSFLPENEVLIRVHYSALNYKDALSATGNKGVTREYPHVPGIDAAGEVLQDKTGRFGAGDRVVVTGHDLGQNTPGGFGACISVPADWVIPLPKTLSLKEAAMFGTAAFTAGYGIHRMKEINMNPGDFPVLVTGATGGVGSFVVHFLSLEGFNVTAATGKLDKSGYLKSLGAAEVINRDELTGKGSRGLLSSKWGAAFDTVGGETLDTVIRQTAHNGVVVCAGNITGHRVDTSIYPFILRGISLLGVDSSNCLPGRRKEIWAMLSGYAKSENPIETKEVDPEELQNEIALILNGKQSGRVTVHHQIGNR